MVAGDVEDDGLATPKVDLATVWLDLPFADGDVDDYRVGRRG